MHSILSNMAPISVAVVVAAMGWLFGGTRSSLVLQVAPWLLLIMTEIAIAFPQKEDGETTYAARERTWQALRKDSFLWVSFALVLLLSIPFANVGLCPTCDAAAIAGGVDPKPPMPLLPFCVNRMQHLNVVLWFVTALLTAIAIRHSLNNRGRRLMISLVVWNGFALAVLGFLQIACGARGPLWALPSDGQPVQEFFSTFGYPNMAGAYFTLLFGLAFAMWRQRMDELGKASSGELRSRGISPRKLVARKYVLLIPMTVLFIATVNTLSRAAIMLVSSLAVVCAMHTYHSFASRLSKAVRVKRGIICLVAIAIGAVAVMAFIPENVQREVGTIQTHEVLDRVTGKDSLHSRVATQLWRQHRLFGCGGWGYRHLGAQFKSAFERRESRYRGNANVHNDYLQFMVEHGLVGFSLMVVLVIMLLSPVVSVWRYLASVARFVDAKNRPPTPIGLFALPAAAFCILAALCCTLIHAFGDCPLRSPAVLLLFTAALAAIPGYLPAMPSEEERNRTSGGHGHRHHEHRHHRHVRHETVDDEGEE